MGRRSKYMAQFKAKVDFEAAKGNRSINEIAAEYGVHPQQVRAWKRDFLEKMKLAFEKNKDAIALQKELWKTYQEMEQLDMGRGFYRNPDFNTFKIKSIAYQEHKRRFKIKR